MRLKLSLKYALSTAVVLIAVIGAVFYIVSKRHERLVLAQIEAQAKALFQQVVITRRWVADHGGVFVEKLPWVRPNPYLPNSTVMDTEGRRYVKQNPALVTKELSSYAQKEGLYFFHITSLKLLNPENAPDPFEKKALEEFEKGAKAEAAAVNKIGKYTYFRYIAPLKVEASCLVCHAHQGYKIGDIRGAISISVPVDGVLGTMSRGRRYMLVGAVVVTGLLMLFLFIITRRLVIKPISTMRKRMYVFSKNGNPDIPIIKTGDELEDLSASFREMARSIDEYHRCLQEKIKAATKELSQKNEELVKLNMSKSDFIAKVSHELRTPLTTIKGAMDYLSAKFAYASSYGNEDVRAFFDMIKNNTERLIRLVNNMLDYERIELGRFEMAMKEVNFRSAFEEVAASFRPVAEEKGVGIRLSVDDVVAVADEDRIKQVLTNLLSNALNFSPPHSVITVSLSRKNGMISAAVEDEGPGVPERHKDRIFEQFYTKGVKDGTGLGLAICRGIIEAHGGRIGVEAKGGGGSRFWFIIPREQESGLDSRKEASCSR